MLYIINAKKFRNMCPNIGISILLVFIYELARITPTTKYGNKFIEKSEVCNSANIPELIKIPDPKLILEIPNTVDHPERKTPLKISSSKIGAIMTVSIINPTELYLYNFNIAF